jgi:uncharacterized protein YjbI with pentapeptide repeats
VSTATASNTTPTCTYRLPQLLVRESIHEVLADGTSVWRPKRNVCTRPSSQPDQLCLMHSPDSGKNADLFWRYIVNQIDSGNLDFTGYVFPNWETFPPIPYDATFRGCRFTAGADFGGVTFGGMVDFDGAEFLDRADFGKAKFTGKSSFSCTAFRERVSFDEAEFCQDTEFLGTVFELHADFGRVIWDGQVLMLNIQFVGSVSFALAHSKKSARIHGGFEGEALFKRTIFADDVYLAECEFEHRAIFERARFEQSVSMEKTVFSADTNFIDAKFSGNVDFSWAGFWHYVQFKGARFDKSVLFFHNPFVGTVRFDEVQFSEAIFRAVDLTNVYFKRAGGLAQAEFDNVTWPSWPRPRQWYLQDRPAIADEWEARLSDPTALPEVERLYRSIRLSYEAKKDHSQASHFYFAEMEMKRLAHRGSEYARRFGSLTAWYGLVSGYGERWVRSLAWFLGLWLVCGLAYAWQGIWVKNVGPAGPESMVSQTTLRYVRLLLAWWAPADSINPDITWWQAYVDALTHSFLVAIVLGRDTYALPAGWGGQLIQTVEIILGPVFLGLMALAVRRRFQR